MTEDEAKTKWCPFARPGQCLPEHCGEIRGNRNMDGTTDDGALCIGSGCMAWRVTRDGSWKGTAQTVTGGFCGLAGPVV
jgi:hypothetical protein